MVMDKALDDIVKDNRKKRQQNFKNKQTNRGQNNVRGRNTNRGQNNRVQNRGQSQGQGQNNRNQNNRNVNQSFNRNQRGGQRNIGQNNRNAVGRNNFRGRGGNNNFNRNFNKNFRPNQNRNAGQNSMVRRGGKNSNNSNRNNNDSRANANNPNFNRQPNRQQMNNNNNNNNNRNRSNFVRNGPIRGRPSYLNRRPPTNPNWVNRNRMVGKARVIGPRGVVSRSSRMNRENTVVRKTGIPVQLHVSNLHFKVSEKDMRELFGEFGKLTKVSLHYDKNGKPQGSCDINFTDKSDAIRALKKYNKVPLDGRPMEIKVVEDLSNRPVAARPVVQKLRREMAQQRVMPRGAVKNLAPRVPNNKRQLMMQRVRKSITRANKVKNMKVMQKSSPKATKTKSPVKKTPTDKKKKALTEEDLDKQLDAYLTAGAM